MFDKVKFKLTKQHLDLIRKMNVGYNDCCEFGAPAIDPKRPYGNGDVYGDISEILGVTPDSVEDDEKIYSSAQEEEMLKLHIETAKALQVILASGSFEPGMYEADEYVDNWVKV